MMVGVKKANEGQKASLLSRPADADSVKPDADPSRLRCGSLKEVNADASPGTLFLRLEPAPDALRGAAGAHADGRKASPSISEGLIPGARSAPCDGTMSSSGGCRSDRSSASSILERPRGDPWAFDTPFFW